MSDEMIKKVKVGLILNEPFFAAPALRMEYVKCGKVEGCATNGLEIRYNETFFSGLTPEERKTVIAHELLHVLLLHHLRRRDRDKMKWNIACDFAVNSILQNHGMSFPKGALLSHQFDGMGAEEIYNKIEVTEQGGNGQDGAQGGKGGVTFGMVEDPPQGEDMKEMEHQAKEMMAQAYHSAKASGKVPQEFERMVSEMLNPKQDWKELLCKFVAEVAKNDFTWTKPNPRYAHMGLYLPAMESLEIGHVVFAIDTSGSIDQKLLTRFVSELQAASSMFTTPITIIHCDSRIQKIEEMVEGDPIRPVGGGGTEFRPVFDYVNEHMANAKALVYFTDGGAWGSYKKPKIPVLWAIYNNKEFNCGFGDVIHVDN